MRSQLSIWQCAVFDWFRYVTEFWLFLPNFPVNKLYPIVRVNDLIKVHLHKAKANPEVRFFHLSLSRLSVNVKLISLWIHLVLMSLSSQYEVTLYSSLMLNVNERFHPHSWIDCLGATVLHDVTNYRIMMTLQFYYNVPYRNCFSASKKWL